MEQHVRNNTLANYAYVMMAHPIQHGAPAFFLAVFGTNNSFTANDVQKRWQWMVSTAKEEGIDILGFPADGDPRVLSAMLRESCTPDSVPLA